MGFRMMQRRFSCVAFYVLLGVTGTALAANDVPIAENAANLPAAASMATAAPETPSDTETLFAHAPVFKGNLGDLKVQVSLRQKDDMREGLSGTYFVFGASQQILLAGEFDRDGTIFLEESENGRNVSGQWDGKLTDDTFSGTWSSFDGTVSKPFVLKIIPVNQLPPSKPLDKTRTKASLSTQ